MFTKLLNLCFHRHRIHLIVIVFHYAYGPKSQYSLILDHLDSGPGVASKRLEPFARSSFVVLDLSMSMP